MEKMTGATPEEILRRQIQSCASRALTLSQEGRHVNPGVLEALDMMSEMEVLFSNVTIAGVASLPRPTPPPHRQAPAPQEPGAQNQQRESRAVETPPVAQASTSAAAGRPPTSSSSTRASSAVAVAPKTLPSSKGRPAAASRVVSVVGKAAKGMRPAEAAGRRAAEEYEAANPGHREAVARRWSEATRASSSSSASTRGSLGVAVTISQQPVGIGRGRGLRKREGGDAQHPQPPKRPSPPHRQDVRARLGATGGINTPPRDPRHEYHLQNLQRLQAEFQALNDQRIQDQERQRDVIEQMKVAEDELRRVMRWPPRRDH